jgi:hypothetical protein
LRGRSEGAHGRERVWEAEPLDIQPKSAIVTRHAGAFQLTGLIQKFILQEGSSNAAQPAARGGPLYQGRARAWERSPSMRVGFSAYLLGKLCRRIILPLVLFAVAALPAFCQDQSVERTITICVGATYPITIPPPQAFVSFDHSGEGAATGAEGGTNDVQITGRHVGESTINFQYDYNNGNPGVHVVVHVKVINCPPPKVGNQSAPPALKNPPPTATGSGTAQVPPGGSDAGVFNPVGQVVNLGSGASGSAAGPGAQGLTAYQLVVTSAAPDETPPPAVNTASNPPGATGQPAGGNTDGGNTTGPGGAAGAGENPKPQPAPAGAGGLLINTADSNGARSPCDDCDDKALWKAKMAADQAATDAESAYQQAQSEADAANQAAAAQGTAEAKQAAAAATAKENQLHDALVKAQDAETKADQAYNDCEKKKQENKCPSGPAVNQAGNAPAAPAGQQGPRQTAVGNAPAAAGASPLVNTTDSNGAKSPCDDCDDKALWKAKMAADQAATDAESAYQQAQSEADAANQAAGAQGTAEAKQAAAAATAKENQLHDALVKAQDAEAKADQAYNDCEKKKQENNCPSGPAVNTASNTAATPGQAAGGTGGTIPPAGAQNAPARPGGVSTAANGAGPTTPPPARPGDEIPGVGTVQDVWMVKGQRIVVTAGGYFWADQGPDGNWVYTPVRLSFDNPGQNAPGAALGNQQAPAAVGQPAGAAVNNPAARTGKGPAAGGKPGPITIGGVTYYPIDAEQLKDDQELLQRLEAMAQNVPTQSHVTNRGRAGFKVDYTNQFVDKNGTPISANVVYGAFLVQQEEMQRLINFRLAVASTAHLMANLTDREKIAIVARLQDLANTVMPKYNDYIDKKAQVAARPGGEAALSNNYYQLKNNPFFQSGAGVAGSDSAEYAARSQDFILFGQFLAAQNAFFQALSADPLLGVLVDDTKNGPTGSMMSSAGSFPQIHLFEALLHGEPGDKLKAVNQALARAQEQATSQINRLSKLGMEGGADLVELGSQQYAGAAAAAADSGGELTQQLIASLQAQYEATGAVAEYNNAANDFIIAIGSALPVVGLGFQAAQLFFNGKDYLLALSDETNAIELAGVEGYKPVVSATEAREAAGTSLAVNTAMFAGSAVAQQVMQALMDGKNVKVASRFRGKSGTFVVKADTPAKINAIEDAHLVGLGELGADGGPARLNYYTFGQKRLKWKILRQAGFSPEEAKWLMQNGVVGINPLDPATWGGKISARELSPGRFETSYNIDDGTLTLRYQATDGVARQNLQRGIRTAFPTQSGEQILHAIEPGLGMEDLAGMARGGTMQNQSADKIMSNAVRRALDNAPPGWQTYVTVRVRRFPDGWISFKEYDVSYLDPSTGHIVDSAPAFGYTVPASGSNEVTPDENLRKILSGR